MENLDLKSVGSVANGAEHRRLLQAKGGNCNHVLVYGVVNWLCLLGAEPIRPSIHQIEPAGVHDMWNKHIAKYPLIFIEPIKQLLAQDSKAEIPR
jgi:hypothetical protein